MILGNGYNRQPRTLRRSKRLGLTMPVFIFGQSIFREAFSEATRMLSVNANGGALSLGVRVEKGQTVLLVNRMTRQEQQCRVAHVGSLKDGKWTVGLEFAGPNANFWRIHFPPQSANGRPNMKTA
jgi:hypothetical protein